MNKVILLHGTCSKEEYFDAQKYRSLSNNHWFPWMQKQLLVKGYEAHTPEVFEAYIPTYEKWLRELNRYVIDGNTILIGHSCGAGFLMRWIAENPESKVKKIILVAPWLDPEKEKSGDMFDFDMKLDEEVLKKIVIYESDDDSESIKKSVEMIQDSSPGIRSKQFTGYGHFTYGSMQTEEFPELLEECLV